MGFKTKIDIDTEKSRDQIFKHVWIGELFINESKEYCIKINVSDNDSFYNAFNITKGEVACFGESAVVERIPSAEQELFTLTLRKN